MATVARTRQLVSAQNHSATRSVGHSVKTEASANTTPSQKHRSALAMCHSLERTATPRAIRAVLMAQVNADDILSPPHVIMRRHSGAFVVWRSTIRISDAA